MTSMAVTNSRKLAAVLSEWVRPAISQIASAKLMSLPVMKSLQATIGGSGLVSGGYSLAKDLQPMIQPVVDAMIEPIMERYLGNIPDAMLPKTARSIVDAMLEKGEASVLDGLITFNETDLEELSDLLSKNLPVEDEEIYRVIH